MVLKMIHFFYLVLHVQTDNQIIYKRSISRDYFNELILKASVSCSEINQINLNLTPCANDSQKHVLRSDK